jgi:hypothetical protein
MELPMAFIVEGREEPAIGVRVNFGVFAGREATAAGLDRLAEWLLDEVDDAEIISEKGTRSTGASKPPCTRS